VAFKFRFENILKYRENIEKQKSLDFLNAEEAYNRQIKKIKILEEKRDEIFSSLKEISSSPNFDIISFNMLRSFALKIENDIRFEREILFQLKEIMELKRQELIKASQEKKVMEKLREKDYNNYIDFMNKKETIELDEISSKAYNKRNQTG